MRYFFETLNLNENHYYLIHPYPASLDTLEGDTSMRIPSSLLFTGDTSRDDDRLALPELVSIFNGRPKDAPELLLFSPDFSGEVEDADIGKILAGESFFCSGT